LPAVGIVTPSFQQAEFLEETIRSVLLQGYPRLSYAIMDGGSTDGSLAVIEKYHPWLAHWASGPDGGQASAIDQGFQRIPGEILAWLNSDDVFTPGAIWRAAQAFARRPSAVVVYGDAEEINRDGGRIGRAYYVRQADRQYLLHTANAIAQPSAFFRRAAYDAAGGLDPKLHWALDYELWLRLADQGEFAYISETLAQMRIYPEAKTSRGLPAMFYELRQVAERYGGSGQLNQMIGWLIPGLLPKALAALRAGDWTHGQAWLESVIANDPAWRSEDRLAKQLADEAWRLMNAGNEPAETAVQWVKQVCAGLPEQFVSPSRIQRQVLGLLYESLAFRNYSLGRGREGLRYAIRAVRQDHRRAANRGLWSISLRALAGGTGR
jgi:hypothetical protein